MIIFSNTIKGFSVEPIKGNPIWETERFTCCTYIDALRYYLRNKETTLNEIVLSICSSEGITQTISIKQ